MRTLIGLFTFMFGAGSQLPVYAKNDNFVIVDVRTPAEFEESHVTGAINVDFLNSEFRKKMWLPKGSLGNMKEEIKHFKN